MSRIDLSQLAHSYMHRPDGATDYALQRMDHVWDDGGAYALLGPSGCGKTTLLNIISGLLRPSEGQVRFDERDVTALTPEQRNVAQVFQFPVIYDTMTVRENLAFPLRNRRMSSGYIRGRVAEVAEMLDLGGVLDRKAANLGADAKQKISMGRGLVREDVAAILFDEPLTVIDPHLKWQLRRKLKEIHERLGLTLVYVTHDQTEALTFADKVAVMHQGKVLQIGTPQELFENPAHTFVGYFIGSPGMNFLDCRLDGDIAVIEGERVALSAGLAARAEAGRSQAGQRLQIGIRPEFLRLESAGSGGVPVAVERVEDLGNFQIVTVRMGQSTLHVKLDEQTSAPAGDARLVFPLDWTRLYADDRLVG